ncbi:hypothetical protein AB0D08_18670 [Kitasatospora sp. NPDC048540]|uniref:hypothetical protein n=1 Tax=Kitasatospora sp. NPDC048540 TaxID=3155634 RepID=UPI0033D82EC9
MSSIYLSAQAWLESSDAEEVLLPEGKRVVFHARAGTFLAEDAGMRVLQIQPETGYDEFSRDPGGAPVFIPNYTFSGMTDLEISVESVVAQDGGSAYPILWLSTSGFSDTRFCESPENCRDGSRHSCGGILDPDSSIGVQLSHYDVLHIVACRAPSEGVHGTTYDVPTDTDPQVLLSAADAKRMMRRLINEDSDEAYRYWQGIGEQTRAFILGSSKAIENWWELRCATSVLMSKGPKTFYKYCKSQDPAVRKNILKDEHLRSAYLLGRRRAQN